MAARLFRYARIVGHDTAPVAVTPMAQIGMRCSTGPAPWGGDETFALASRSRPLGQPIVTAKP